MFYAAVIVVLMNSPTNPTKWMVGTFADMGGPYYTMYECRKVLNSIVVPPDFYPHWEEAFRACKTREEWEEVLGKDIFEKPGEDT